MGYNAYGQLGTGNTTDKNTPVQVATGVDQLSEILSPSDSDGDGFDDEEESALGMHPNLADEFDRRSLVQDSSAPFDFLTSSDKDYVQKSDPEGHIQAQHPQPHLKTRLDRTPAPCHAND